MWWYSRKRNEIRKSNQWPETLWMCMYVSVYWLWSNLSLGVSQADRRVELEKTNLSPYHNISQIRSTPSFLLLFLSVRRWKVRTWNTVKSLFYERIPLLHTHPEQRESSSFLVWSGYRVISYYRFPASHFPIYSFSEVPEQVRAAAWWLPYMVNCTMSTGGFSFGKN